MTRPSATRSSRPSATSTTRTSTSLRLASELVVDAIVEPEDLRGELISRFAVYGSKDRRFSSRRHGVTPV